MALVEKFSEVRKVHVGVEANPLVVRHTPPPAAPTQSRQKLGVHPEAVSSTSAVMRPEIVCVEPVKVRTLGSTSVNGPAANQVLNRGFSGGDFLLFLVGFPLPGVGVGVATLPDVATNRFRPMIAFIEAGK